MTDPRVIELPISHSRMTYSALIHAGESPRR